MVFDTLATMFSFEENDNNEAPKLIRSIEDKLLPRMHPRQVASSSCITHQRHRRGALLGEPRH